MKNLGIVSRRAGALALSAGLVTLVAACGSSSGSSSGASSASASSPKSITVAVAYPAPPKALLDQFTQQTGIHVNYTNVEWEQPADQDRRGWGIEHLLRRRHRRQLVKDR